MIANDFRKMFHHFASYGFENVIYVIEEIDTHKVFLSRNNEEVNNDKLSTILEHIKQTNKRSDDNDEKHTETQISITEILEAFDGLCETPGLMMIATTNHLEKLDPAIVRRFGLRIKMGLLCRETFTMIIERHYKRSIDDETWAAISYTAERMSPNNLIDLCVQNEDYDELITYIRSLNIGDADSLVESEQSSPK
jgi:SpoVK/Ycf46/Vps4 family AAA+-type ATPase